MRKAIAGLIILCLGLSTATAQDCDPVFPDYALRFAVQASGGSDPAEPWLLPDSNTILNLISLVGGGTSGMTGELLHDLTGLECAANLQDIMLTPGAVSDLTPIGDLQLLRWVDFTDNRVADLTPLADMGDLEVVIFLDNWIADVSPLATLPALWWGYLDGNSIQDISALASITGLGKLHLTGNPLNQAAYDTYLPLILANNPGIDLQYDPYIPRGDADMDGDVDLDDFVALKSGFNAAGDWRAGDFDGSGMIDLDDFVVLKSNFSSAAVPEPTSAMFLCVGLAAHIVRRRSKGGALR